MIQLVRDFNYCINSFKRVSKLPFVSSAQIFYILINSINNTNMYLNYLDMIFYNSIILFNSFLSLLRLNNFSNSILSAFNKSILLIFAKGSIAKRSGLGLNIPIFNLSLLNFNSISYANLPSRLSNLSFNSSIFSNKFSFKFFTAVCYLSTSILTYKSASYYTFLTSILDAFVNKTSSYLRIISFCLTKS